MERQNEKSTLAEANYLRDSFVETLTRMCREEGKFLANLVRCSRCKNTQCALWPEVAGVLAVMCCVCRTVGTSSEVLDVDAPPDAELPIDVYHTGRMLFSLDAAVRVHGRFQAGIVRCTRCRQEQVAAWPKQSRLPITCPCCGLIGTTEEMRSREVFTEKSAARIANDFANPKPLDEIL